MPRNKNEDNNIKGILKPPAEQSKFFFRGGGSVLKPNHITRYIYPSLCGYPKGCLRLQAPVNSKKRSRPQGPLCWGTDGHTFLTITRSYRGAPSKADFDHVSTQEREQDEKSANPTGRAMTRMTKYTGNTLLESGKFALKKGEPLVYVIKRTTSILLSGGDGQQFGVEQETYIIECDKWRALRPPSEPGHDSWWMRLHDLYQASFDRAFFHQSDGLDHLGIAPLIVQWYPRPDIEAQVKIHRTPPPTAPEHLHEECMICGKSWFTESEYACEMKCGHFLCMECFVAQCDEKGGRGNLLRTEIDPNTNFFRCPYCKDINSLPIDRATLVRPVELAYWRWKICMRRLEKEDKDYWTARLMALPEDRWFPDITGDWNHNRLKDKVQVYVRYDDAVRFMEQTPKKIWKMLSYGFSLDNPVDSKEAGVLENALKAELKRLSLDRRRVFNTADLIEHMKDAGKKAFTPKVVGSKEARLGNPEYPPGYLAYRDFLCEWTARGCFLGPSGRVELVRFMDRMERERNKAWWGGDREVMFDP